MIISIENRAFEREEVKKFPYYEKIINVYSEILENQKSNDFFTIVKENENLSKKSFDIKILLTNPS